jgi:hypothetical protein
VRVTGFYDMRPVDWVSGKRMPLEDGMGHFCDRCGREHALVYELTDDDNGKTYKVGSGCAKQDFGFDVEKDATAKILVKTSKRETELAVDAKRRTMLAEAVDIILTEFELRQRPPTPEVEVRQPAGPDVVRVGDSPAWVQFRTLEETVEVAVRGWFERRIKEMTPDGWEKSTILDRPQSSSRSSTPMAVLLLHKVMSSLRYQRGGKT